MFPMLMITSIYVSHVDDKEYLYFPDFKIPKLMVG